MTTVREVLFGTDADVTALTREIGSAVPLPEAVTHLLPMADIIGALWDLLDVPVEDLITTAWQKHQQVLDAQAATANKPGSRTLVEIKGHTIRSTHRPRIEILVDGKVVHTVPVELTLELKIALIVVTVSNGSVLGIGPGDATAEATLKAENITLIDRKLAQVSLPGSLHPAQN